MKAQRFLAPNTIHTYVRVRNLKEIGKGIRCNWFKNVKKPHRFLARKAIDTGFLQIRIVSERHILKVVFTGLRMFLI
jgi:hypothetical protein